MKCPKCGGEKFKVVEKNEVDYGMLPSNKSHISGRLNTYHICTNCGWCLEWRKSFSMKDALFYGLVLVMIIMISFVALVFWILLKLHWLP